jgi:hypothetical protein
MISEYSSIEVMRTLRNTVFTKAAPYFRDLVLEPKVMQEKVESIREFYHLRFQTVFVKDFLIKLIAGLVKEPQQAYFSEEPLDFAKIEPSLVFSSLVSYLKDLMK